MPGAIRKAVFPVAGLGTRFLPATRAVPKELLPIVDRPLIDYAIAEARAAGIDTMIFVTGLESNATALRNHLNLPPDRMAALAEKSDALRRAMEDADLPAGAVQFTTQEEPLGLGHAVWCAREAVGDEPFAVILPDDLMDAEKPAIGQLIDVFEETGGAVVAVEDVPREDTARYGVLDPGEVVDRRVEVKGLVEKPQPEDAPSTLSVIGRYVLPPEVFDQLSRFETGAGGEIQLTDAMAKLIGERPFHGLRTISRRFDCGSKLGFIAAQIAYALKDPEIGEDIAKHIEREIAG